jgi:hypothetical protein
MSVLLLTSFWDMCNFACAELGIVILRRLRDPVHEIRKQTGVIRKEKDMKNDHDENAVQIQEVVVDGTLKQIVKTKAVAYVKTGQTDGRRFVISVKNKTNKPILIAVHL